MSGNKSGVLSIRVGYSGGSNDHPTYRNHPGHAEAPEIVFDPGMTASGLWPGKVVTEVMAASTFWEAEPEH